MAIDWNTIYQQEYAKLPDTAGLLQRQEDRDFANLKSVYDTNTTKLQSQLKDALTAAYVTNELSKRDLATRLAAQGISGGMTETAADDILRDQRNADNTANNSYNTSYGDLTNTYSTNVAGMRANYGTKIAQAQADRVNSATANANTVWNQILQQQQADAAAAAKSRSASAKTQTGYGSGESGIYSASKGEAGSKNNAYYFKNGFVY